MMTDSRLSQAAGAAPLPVASGDPAAAALRCFLSCSLFRRFVHLQSHFFYLHPLHLYLYLYATRISIHTNRCHVPFSFLSLLPPHSFHFRANNIRGKIMSGIERVRRGTLNSF